MTEKSHVNRAGYSSTYLSEATIHNGLIYCSGKIGLDSKTGQLVSDDVREQTKAALGLLESVLHAAGSDLTNILKCNIFLTNMDDFAAMNAAYTAIISEPRPARICVGNTSLGKGAKVEIDCVAIAGAAKPNKLKSRL